ncbi:MAG TPA: alpha/beta fold hydrolase [Sphingomicrobium sp.]|nr:alpha/beta fold hydrolase [Sphingomicrobium sp.]
MLHDQGGSGPIAVIVPSLINPPRILDLDEEVSLTAAVARMGRRVLLLDWGKADERSSLSVAGHIEELLVPLLRSIGEPAALIGYCLGGTMAIAAERHSNVERVVTIASPWHFDRYPETSRRALAGIWRSSKDAARQLGALPMEVLQAAFWSIDPERTVRKFADFGRLDPKSPQARRFVVLEEWANSGESLPYPAAKELIEGLFGEDLPGARLWRVGGKSATDELSVPSLHLVAEHDRIAPASTAPAGKRVVIPSGHVGMIVGSSRKQLHEALDAFLGE